MLSEFGADGGEFLDGLLTRSLAALIKEGLATLDEVITDGTKIRAAASRSSMRRRQTLAELEEKARAKVSELKQELEADSAAGVWRPVERRRFSSARHAPRLLAAPGAQPHTDARNQGK